MSSNKKALIVGCGISGSVVARELAEAGYRVVILEKRNHIAGNMYDYYDVHGVLVHKYGPHTFHTDSENLYRYINRFCKWKEYHLECGAVINGKCTPTPFNFHTIDDFFDEKMASTIKEHLLKAYPGKQTVTVTDALQSSDEVVKEYAQFLFDNDYRLYTAKQWGVSPDEIDSSVLKRVPLRIGYGVGYFNDKYQVMPEKSYQVFFKSLLNHPNIHIILGIDALDALKVEDKNIIYDNNIIDYPVIYTAPLDELFALKYGKLPYRSLRFVWEYEELPSKQNMAVVAYPQEEKYTRIVEYKKLPCQNVVGTTYAIEYPIPYDKNVNNEPYYPILTDKSQILYSKYLQEANKIKDLYLCGRLADFKYYNMDQALERALSVANNIITKRKM